MHRGLLILYSYSLHLSHFDNDSAQSLDGYGKLKVVDLWQWFEVDMRDIRRLNTLYSKVLSSMTVALVFVPLCCIEHNLISLHTDNFAKKKLHKSHICKIVYVVPCVCVFACVIFSCEFPCRLAGNHSFSLPLNNTLTHTQTVKIRPDARVRLSDRVYLFTVRGT